MTPDAVVCELFIIFESQMVTSSNEILSSVTDKSINQPTNQLHGAESFLKSY